jgi:hypothetical protein
MGDKNPKKVMKKKKAEAKPVTASTAATPAPAKKK